MHIPFGIIVIDVSFHAWLSLMNLRVIDIFASVWRFRRIDLVSKVDSINA